MFKRLLFVGAAPALAGAMMLSSGASKAQAQRGRPAPLPGGIAPSGAPIGQPGTANAPPPGTSPTQPAPGLSGTNLPNPTFGTSLNPLSPTPPLSPLSNGGNAASSINPLSPTGGGPVIGPLLNPLATGGNYGTDFRAIQTNPFFYNNYTAPYGYGGFPNSFGYGAFGYGGFGYGTGGFYGSTYNPPTMSRASEAIIDTPGWVSNVETVQGTGQRISRIGPPASGTAPSESSTGEVIIRVPTDAKVWINGKELKGEGAERMFTTPALTPGQSRAVNVRATWNQDGYDVTRTASVVVLPGDQKSVIFMGHSAPRE